MDQKRIYVITQRSQRPDADYVDVLEAYEDEKEAIDALGVHFHDFISQCDSRDEPLFIEYEEQHNPYFWCVTGMTSDIYVAEESMYLTPVILH